MCVKYSKQKFKALSYASSFLKAPSGELATAIIPALSGQSESDLAVQKHPAIVFAKQAIFRKTSAIRLYGS